MSTKELGVGKPWRRRGIAGFVQPKACRESEPTLKVVRVRADGRCMFRSIARALAWMTGQANISESLERNSADTLREAAYQVICVKKREWFSRMGIVEGDIDVYCNKMRFPNFFGGEPELYVLSEDVLKRPIAVYIEKENGDYLKLLEYGSRFAKPRNKGKGVVRLLYNGRNHYDALVVDSKDPLRNSMAL